jgi:hypothetical protein
LSAAVMCCAAWSSRWLSLRFSVTKV